MPGTLHYLVLEMRKLLGWGSSGRKHVEDDHAQGCRVCYCVSVVLWSRTDPDILPEMFYSVHTNNFFSNSAKTDTFINILPVCSPFSWHKASLISSSLSSSPRVTVCLLESPSCYWFCAARHSKPFGNGRFWSSTLEEFKYLWNVFRVLVSAHAASCQKRWWGNLRLQNYWCFGGCLTAVTLVHLFLKTYQ